MKAAETAVDIVLDISKNSHGNVCSEILGKICEISFKFCSKTVF